MGKLREIRIKDLLKLRTWQIRIIHAKLKEERKENDEYPICTQHHDTTWKD